MPILFVMGYRGIIGKVKELHNITAMEETTSCVVSF